MRQRAELTAYAVCNLVTEIRSEKEKPFRGGMRVQSIVHNFQRSSKVRAFSLFHSRFDKMLSFFGRALQRNVEGTCGRYQGRTSLRTGGMNKCLPCASNQPYTTMVRVDS